MTRRFNPPPNWPKPPEGWTPDPGWQPDPTWGPPPDGWQLWTGEEDPAPKRGWLPQWRILTWVILAFNLLMLIWLVAGLGSAADNCAGEVGDAKDACEAGTAIGAGLAGFFIILLWALGDVILGVIWLVTRGNKRSCPVCGNSIKKGQMRCASCGYDFRSMLQAR